MDEYKPGFSQSGSGGSFGGGSGSDGFASDPIGGGGGFLGKTIKIRSIVIDAKRFAELMTDIQSLTFKAAVRDVEYYRKTGGGHIPFSQGSAINWSDAQIEWSDFGAENSSLSNARVVNNFVTWVLGF